MFNKNNKSHAVGSKGQIFVISVIIAVTMALITSYILLHYMFKETNPDQHLGVYQSSIIDSMAEGDKTLLYIDQASKMAVANALDEYIYGNPKPSMNVEGGDTENVYCGSYVYKMWNVENKDCYPNYNSQDFELNKLINSHLAELTYLQQSKGEYPILDRILREKVDYRYSYKAETGSTTIIATTGDTYNIDVFRDEDVAESSEIQRYLSNKNAFSGQLTWPLANRYVSSCFGYRGKIDEIASQNHPGIDIPAPKGTPVMAAASGTVEQILWPQWGKVVINHGGGLSTVYLHMDKIADGLKVGDNVQQGQVIGTVGGRDDTSADRYSPHLHFAVMSTTVDLNTEYKDVIAVIKDLYVNPICFFNEADIRQNVQFNMQSQSCNNICSENGGTCVAPESDVAGDAPYKFCDVYTGILSQGAACQKTDKFDWYPTDIKLSSASLTSNQVLNIYMSVENKMDMCISVKPTITISDTARPQYLEDNRQIFVGKDFFNIYKSTDASKYTTFEAFSCSFTSDEAVAKKGISEGKCVILMPKDKTEIRYMIYPEVTDYFKTKRIFNPKYIYFTVKKVSGTSGSAITTNQATQSSQSTQSSNLVIASQAVQLSKSEQLKLDKTKQNLESIGIMEYISEQAQREGISKELILGLITQESGGDMHAGSSAGAYGLMQVMKSTFDGIKFANKCTWDEYKNDAQCQVRTGIAVLKQKYSEVNGRTLYYSCNTNCWGRNSKGDEGYWSSCSSGCSSTKCIGPTDKTYSEWEAALRRYNGGGDFTAPTGNAQTSGCVGQPDYDYVEHVMKYAMAWGYAGSYDSQIKEEMYVGILGAYTIKPTFNVKMNFDIRLFDMLKQFSQDTVKRCGDENVVRADCLKNQIDAFNKDLPSEYTNVGVQLSQSCDDGVEMTAVNRFVEEVDNCMMSVDDKCLCGISASDVNMKIESSDGSTKISYYSNQDNKMHYAYFDYGVIKTDSTYWNGNNIKARNVVLSKNGNVALLDVTNSNKCNIARNKFRLCLNTGYKYAVYDRTASAQIVDKTFMIPFAITIRDDVAPTPLTNIRYDSVKHSKNSIILRWPKGKEGDIVGYHIYLADRQNQFSGRTEDFTDIMEYKSVSALAQDYAEYVSIDLVNPQCKLEDAGLTSGLGGTEYCTFEYSAVDTTNNPVKITLEEEKIYYLSGSKEFLYVLSGQNVDNGLQSGRDKFVAVTAVDIDGNEIDNLKTNEKITLGQNLITVQPKDLLEAGFTEITGMRITNNNIALIVSWNTVQKYIDGTSIDAQQLSQIQYRVYIGGYGCPDGEMRTTSQLNVFSGGIGTGSKNTDVGIQIAGLAPGDYCVGVSAILGNTKGYENVIGRNVQILPLTP
jgi:murein DD-endopeptidase MepM/ murein hydrolase activator NlpD